jgi:hypothetical protein
MGVELDRAGETCRAGVLEKENNLLDDGRNEGEKFWTNQCLSNSHLYKSPKQPQTGSQLVGMGQEKSLYFLQTIR